MPKDKRERLTATFNGHRIDDYKASLEVLEAYQPEPVAIKSRLAINALFTPEKLKAIFTIIYDAEGSGQVTLIGEWDADNAPKQLRLALPIEQWERLDHDIYDAFRQSQIEGE